MPRWLWIVLGVAVLALLWAGRRPGGDIPPTPDFACPLPQAVSTGDAPRQSAVPAGLASFRRGDATITPLAGYSIEARVLAREDYHLDAGARFSPTDLALGWQRMSEPANYQALNISQSGRWYFYRWGSDGPPLEQSEIIRSSANTHLIPGNAQVADALARIDAEQMVRIDGWLVEVNRDDGWSWRSSLSREDSGDGSCELLYVCALSSR